MTWTAARVADLTALRRQIAAEPEPPTPDELAEADALRPRNRSDCRDGLRPCPWVSCRYHLYLEVTDAGSIRVAHPEAEPWEMGTSCALDVADAEPDGVSLAAVGGLLALTRERVRQVEAGALDRLAGGERYRGRRKRRPQPRKGRQGPHHPPEVRQEAMEAFAAGLTLQEVSDSTGVPIRTLRDWRDGRTRWAARHRLELTHGRSRVTAGEEEDRHG